MKYASAGILLSVLMTGAAGCAVPEDAELEQPATTENPLISLNGIGSTAWVVLPEPSSGANGQANMTLLNDYTYDWTTEGTLVDASYPLQDELFLTGAQLSAMNMSAIQRIFKPGETAPSPWYPKVIKFVRFMEHLTACALPPTQTATIMIQDATGVTHNQTYNATFTGLLGLAPGWATNSNGIAGDTTAQQLVTACVAAEMNLFALPVSISMRDPDAPTTTPSTAEKASYPYLEGAFFGNLFLGSGPQLYSCSYPSNAGYATGVGRNCTGPGSPCVSIVDTGACTSACNSTYTGDDTGSPSFLDLGTNTKNTVGFNTCSGGGTSYPNVMTVFLGASSLPAGELAVKSFPASGFGSVTCPAGATLAGLSASVKNGSNAAVASALCKTEGTDTFPNMLGGIAPPGAGITTTIAFKPNTSVTRSSRIFPSSMPFPGSGNYKLECSETEYVSGITTNNGSLSGVSCTTGDADGTFCRVLSFASGDNRDTTLSGNWPSSGSHTGECALNEHIGGIAFGPGATPAPLSILCCTN